MKRILAILLVIALLLPSVLAFDAYDARQEWQDAKKATQEAKDVHEDAKLAWQADKTPANDQVVIDTGKEVLHAALDEAEAWLVWKHLEAMENADVPDEIAEAIDTDVNINLDKIDALRAEVDKVKNRLELGVTTLRIIGKYFELLADVARNTGSMWVYQAGQYADRLDAFEQKMRDATGDSDVTAKLDLAKAELNKARDNIGRAADTYKEVRIPGTPLIKFAEGNNYLRAAQANMVLAHKYLAEGLALMG